ncbi:hypothetical protein VTO42DRAFT_2929 [Malbranchea cinnamomea]
MADIDEEVIHQPSTSQDATVQVHEDISDETQDFRFINSFSLLSDPTQQTLPRRGEKDFEPNPTLLQAEALASSRQAMHNAISYPRLHNPRNRIIGIYCPDGILIPPGTPADEVEKYTTTLVDSADKKEGNLGERDGSAQKRQPTKKRKFGVGGDTCVCIPSPKGASFKSVGQADHLNRMWLLPEEALYLLERGSLDIRWPARMGRGAASLQGDDATDDIEAGIPMSLQAAYACFIGRGGLTLERYTVYAGLKRGGYTVIRAPSWHQSAESPPLSTAMDENTTAAPATKGWGATAVTGLFSRLSHWIYNPSASRNPAHGPLIGLGFYRSYDDIFRALSIIPSHDPTFPDPPVSPPTNAPYSVAFHVYKPSTVFRKSNPGPPDFRLAVISTRENPTLPSLADLSALLASTPLCPPQGEKMDRLLYMRLRHGWRNVILAIVDQGVVSFLRVSDAGFGIEKLYAAKTGGTGGSKGGGRRPSKKGKK